ncbi:MAG TPA: hypothetical protein VG603_01410 [Chitinophagales bacterium]|nr:hypothetical protein [Chitinophagales bacterium]
MKTTIEIKITKAALKNGNLELEYDEVINSEEDGPAIHSYKLKGGYPPHEDLLNAFKPLDRHLALICEQAEEKRLDYKVSIGKKGKEKDITGVFEAMDESPAFTSITATGFSIGGNDEGEGVVLIGQRKLSTGMILNLVSPFTKYEGEYKSALKLAEDVDMLCGECTLYIEGKHAPNAQLEMEFEEQQVPPEQ